MSSIDYSPQQVALESLDSEDPILRDEPPNPSRTGHPAQPGELLCVTRLPFAAPVDMHRRLRRFLDFAHGDAAVYSLGQVPAQVEWGASPLAHVLHDPSVGQPIKIWVVGAVVDLQGRLTSAGYAGNASPESTTMLRLCLMRAADGNEMARLISLGRRNPWFDGNVFECGISYTSPWYNQSMFPGVYDATQAFRAKALMPRIGMSDLVRGDVVLAECCCIRSPEIVGWRVVGPTTWRVWFEMGAVSLLARAPRLPAPYVPDTFNGCM